MPFFENAKGTVTINDSSMTEVKGNMYHHDHSTHVTNKDSYNTTTRSTANSHNDSSKVERGNSNTYNTHQDGRRVISGLTHVTVRGVPQTPQTRANGKAKERAQSQNLERRETDEHQQLGREKGPQRLLEERQRPAYNLWQGGYAPAESMRRHDLENRQELREHQLPTPPRESRRPTGYPPQEHYEMGDPQPGHTPAPPRLSSPKQSSLNPFLRLVQQPPPPPPPLPASAAAQFASLPNRQLTFEEFTASAWGTK